MDIIIFGASGGVGKHFTKLALDNGHSVTAYIRTPSKLDINHDNLTIIQGDAFDKQAVEAAINGKDAVVSCLGSTTGMKNLRS